MNNRFFRWVKDLLSFYKACDNAKKRKDDWSAWNDLGACYLKLKLYSDAKVALSKSIEIESRYINNKLMRDALYAMGDFTASHIYMQKATRILKERKNG